ncbi:UNKNOWN [Stylonychia lemnae]|uniref:Uncharacterized protein n=1 Tax=Stylonychia lemnae TaxID=5949 RepID=A0A078APU3_STYLE|nr:UNKNOWN [Stylonychia lemnae]|eukprot:CDW84184.1 UNKNOWN [Stylonychia lemnae]
MCSTNTTVYSCRSSALDTDCNKNTFKTNLFSTCHNVNGTNIFTDDTQCKDKYYITKDYFGLSNARTIQVTLAKNKICPVQIFNQIGDGIPGFITIQTANKANITYKQMNKTIYFNNSGDFDMNSYKLATTTKFTIAEGEGIALIGSNPFVNGTPTVFEIKYQDGKNLKVGVISFALSLLTYFFT